MSRIRRQGDLRPRFQSGAPDGLNRALRFREQVFQRGIKRFGTRDGQDFHCFGHGQIARRANGFPADARIVVICHRAEKIERDGWIESFPNFKRDDASGRGAGQGLRGLEHCIDQLAVEHVVPLQNPHCLGLLMPIIGVAGIQRAKPRRCRFGHFPALFRRKGDPRAVSRANLGGFEKLE